MSRLLDLLRAEAGLQDLAEALEGARRELAGHRAGFQDSLKGLEQSLVAAERQAVERTFDDYARLLSKLERQLSGGDRAAAASELETLLREMAAAQLRYRDSSWQARGPTSHPGVNELLSLLDRPSEFLDTCERELLRLQAQQEILPELPPFIAETWEELLPLHRDWLEEVLDSAEYDPESARVHLADWGLQYTACDVDYLSRKYSARPTSLPPVNFALNSQRLCLEGLVPPELVEHAVETVLEMLEAAGVGAGPEAAQASFLEAAEGLRAQLQELQSLEDVAELQRLGAAVCRTVERLTAAQGELDAHLGSSRLDYKAD